MFTTYNTVRGDTFESVSRKVYGVATDGERIRGANPGVLEPIAIGTALIIPGAVPLYNSSATSDPDEVSITIEGKRFTYWGELSITQSIDSISTFMFTTAFQYDLPGFRDTFRPFSFKRMSITIGGELMLSGFIVDIEPSVTASEKTLTVSGYGMSGALNDCTSSPGSYPLEFYNSKLKTITDKLIRPFGLSSEFKSSQGGVFETVSCTPSENVLSFLVTLALQRELLITDTPQGNLLFWRSVAVGKPVAVLRDYISVKADFKPQEYYSHITGLSDVIVGVPGAQYTVVNKHLKGVTRPHVFTISDSEGVSVKGSVTAKLGSMYASACSYSVIVPSWRDPSGALWNRNTTVKIIAEDAMIYSEYEFLIRSVQFEQDTENKTAVLDLVLPGSFSGTMPEVMPWD